MRNNPKITQSIYYFKKNNKYKPLYSHKYMKDYRLTGRKSYIIYRKTKNIKEKPFYGRFYRKSEILKKANKKYTKKNINRRSIRKKTYRKKLQKGGLLPLCMAGGPVCLAGANTIGSGAAVLGAGIVGAGHILKEKMTNSSSLIIKDNKPSTKIYKNYSMERNNGKKSKKTYELKNNKVYLNKKEIKPKEKKTIRRALQLYKKLINDCKKKGFKKCLNN